MDIIDFLHNKGYLSVEQLREIKARLRGGTTHDIVDYLLLNNLVNKTELSEILSQITGLPSVNLSDKVIDKNLSKLLDKKIAFDNFICPFEYDLSENILKVACLKIPDNNLLNRIKEESGISNLELYVTYKTNLECALIELFRGYRDEKNFEDTAEQNSDINKDKIRPGIIVLNPEEDTEIPFWETIVKLGFDVFIVNDKSQAEELLSRRSFSKLYIKSWEKKKFESLIIEFKKSCPGATVTFFGSVSDIIINNYEADFQIDLLKDNFRLMKMVLSKEDTDIFDHVSRVVSLAEKICLKISSSEKLMLLTISAAYLHDFSSYYLNNRNLKNTEREMLRLSGEFLRTFNYHPSINRIVELMYNNITDHAENDILLKAANIITAADYLTHRYSDKPKITIDEYNLIKDDIISKINSLFLNEVSKALLEIQQEKIEVSPTYHKDCHVILFDKRAEDQLMLEKCLENLGLMVEAVHSVDALVESYRKKQPDILVVSACGEGNETSLLIDKIAVKGLLLDEIVTYLLTDNYDDVDFNYMLQRGIEDIFNIESDLDPFLIKIIRASKRAKDKPKEKVDFLQGVGTFGSLSDMNLIDLLQLMNTSGKTCLLNVSAAGHQLSIYVKKGYIIYAECSNLKGEEAVHKGLTWSQGVWSVDPTNDNDIPTGNLNRPIEAVLLEGCYQLDESQRIDTSDVNNIQDFNFIDE